ncbi:GTPase family protein [Congregibacter litoralis]|uniref:Putative GTPase n=1 Tax=Congregibacter litoralis KT71 TaxID=314285 RepID=A4A4W7_9GAMM|nr:GTPase domain-containing protein [Congregibacter litoralis]EAQ98838.1 putative GTPase [Congregibacter litoralis KT71]
MKTPFGSLFALRSRFYWYSAAVLGLAIPVLTLSCVGVYFLWREGWLLWFFFGIALTAIPLIVMSPKPNKPVETDEDTTAPQYLEIKREWSDFDKSVWKEALLSLETRINQISSYQDLEQAALEQWKLVASRYSDDDPLLSFTLPEALLVTEVLSREYRRLVLLHFPVARQLTLGKARHIYNSGTRWYGRYEGAYKIWRVLRAGLNPIGSVASEVRGHAMDAFLGDLSLSARNGLLRVLFEEVTQVAIDLYSGRLRISDEELQHHIKGTSRPVLDPVLPPPRVILVGQVNAGKSTLTNALKNTYVSEVDALPCKTAPTAFLCELPNGTEIELIDSMGLDGSEQALQLNLQTAVNADLVIIVSAANQPNKEPEYRFTKAWRAYFEQRMDRTKPEVVLVTTHNDRLSPSTEWQPPYNLDTCPSAKAKAMRDAIEYLREVVDAGAACRAVPIAVSENIEFYNIDVLSGLLAESAQRARGIQLNRLRTQAAQTAFSTTGSLKSALRAGRWLGKPVVARYGQRWRQWKQSRS